MDLSKKTHREIVEVFHDRAHEYDGWFEESLVYKNELAALKDLHTALSGPKFEIGVGPGRFAGDLGVSFGLDPAEGPLRIAMTRGVSPCRAVGEALPLRDRCVSTLYILFTFCFLQDPGKVLKECCRVLKGKGHLVLGVIPNSSPWGQALLRKKEEGHPFYRHATFYSTDEVLGLLEESGLNVVESRSGLLQPPDSLKGLEKSIKGIHSQAGFVVMCTAKKE